MVEKELTNCYICGGVDDVNLCEMCGVDLCVHCKNNPPKRLIGFLKKKYKGWFPQNEVDEMKRKGTWK